MQEKIAKTTFLVLLVVLLAAFVWIIRPFLAAGLLSILAVVICDPVYQIFLRWVRQKRYLASFLATIFVVLCVMIPLGIIGGVVITNGIDLIGKITSQLESGQLAGGIDGIGSWISAKMQEISGLLPADFDLRATLIKLFNMVGSIAYQYSPKVFSATFKVITNFFIMLIFVFVLFAEGPAAFKAIFSLFPLAEEHKKILVKEIRSVISGTFLGLLATAAAQGVLIGIGFWIAGIPNPFLWGIVAVGVTMVPFIGAVLMYIPASAYLFISGHWIYGLFMFIYGVGIVSTVDNLIKPLIMRGSVNVHPLLLALSIIGGGIWLGLTGMILGPIIVALMFAMLDIYRREFA